MNDPGQEPSRWMFHPSGLLLPAGVVVGNSLDSLLEDSSQLDDRASRALGAVPTYEDLWDGVRPNLDDLLARVPTQLWIRFLSCLATLLSRDNINQPAKHAIVEEMFRPPQRDRLRGFLANTRTAFPITEFPVLLLMELAAARADVSASPPTDSLEPMVQAVYVVWSHLASSTDNRIRRDPAGIAAALHERSIIRSPVRLVRTAFGLWCWEHADLDDDSRAARNAFDGYLRTAYDLSLIEWVTGLTLATLISQNQPPQEAVTNPILITANRPDLSADGRDLLSRCLGHLAATPRDLTDTCRELDRESDLLTEPSLLALKRTPCLMLGTLPSFRSISPVHLAEAAVERPLIERSTPASTRAQARTEYGSVVEAYVHGLLGRIFGERYQRLPTIQGRKRAEGVIWFPNGFLVVECKARRVSELIRYNVREDATYFEELVRSGLETAVQQIQTTTEDILNGAIPQPGALAPATAGSLVVFLQDLALSPISRSVLDRLLPVSKNSAGVLQLRPQPISLERLEELDKWVHLNLLSVLRKKMADTEVALECLIDYLLHEGETSRASSVQHELWQALLAEVRPCLEPTAL